MGRRPRDEGKTRKDEIQKDEIVVNVSVMQGVRGAEQERGRAAHPGSCGNNKKVETETGRESVTQRRRQRNERRGAKKLSGAMLRMQTWRPRVYQTPLTGKTG